MLHARDSDAGNWDAAVSDDTLDAAAQDAAAPSGDASSATPIASACRIAGANSGIFEEFAGAALDGTRFLVAHGHRTLAGRAPSGGFVRDNVAQRDGSLVLSVRGDDYTGPVRGIDASGLARDGRRSGAAVATRDLFASATYSATFQLRGPAGVEVGLFFLRDDDAGEWLEIASDELERGNGPRVRMRSVLASNLGGASELMLAPSSDGRALHSLRFDWYTHAPETARFWIDDEARVESDQRAPDGRAGRMWLLAWVREDGPAAFDTVELRVERAFVTPFGNSGDRCAEALAPPWLALP